MELYRYRPKALDYNIKALSTSENGMNRSSISFPSVFSTGIAENDRVHAELFIRDTHSPEQEKIDDVLILVHGFATKKKKLLNYYYFASSMADRGTPTIFLNLPFHLERTPPGEMSGGRIVYFDDTQTLDFFHQAVVDIRRLTEIISNIYGPKRIHVCGISMGSMVTAIAMAFEEKIKKGVLLIGGGNWEQVHWNGILRYILKGDCSDKNIPKRKECRDTYRDFPEFLKQLKSSKSRVLTSDLESMPELKKVTPKACFLCDPMAFGHMIDPSKVLMINSKFDFYFSRRSTKYLWEELGRPEIKWLGKLHSSSILRNNKIIEIVYSFLNKKD